MLREAFLRNWAPCYAGRDWMVGIVRLRSNVIPVLATHRSVCHGVVGCSCMRVLTNANNLSVMSAVVHEVHVV